ITDEYLGAIKSVIENYAHQHDLPIATAVIPPQDFSTGAVRVAMLPGKIRNVRVEGNRWFSSGVLEDKLRLEPGEVIRTSELDRSISWTNNSNPFHRLRVRIDQVPGTPAEADLTISVQDQFPLRLAAAYDNTGNALLGKDHYT